MKAIHRAMAALWLCFVTSATLTAQTGETTYHPEVKPVVLPIRPHDATAPRVPWCPPEVMARHPRPQQPHTIPNFQFPKPQQDDLLRQKRETFSPFAHEPTTKTSTAVDPVIGASFRGNEGKFISSPPDNSIAISDDGYIVSATNETVEYYDEMGNRLQLINSLYDFVGDTNATLIFGDPRVLYDPYYGRFIFAVLEGSNSQTSTIHLLFSRTGDPRDGWTDYELKGDTLQEGYWADYPHIAINEKELFVTAFMAQDSTNLPKRNKIWQISKKEPMNSQPNLVMKIWLDATTTSGDTALGLVPLSDGLGMAEEPGIWMVATDGGGGSEVHFFHIEDSIAGSNNQISSFSIITTPYSPADDAEQLNTTDVLESGDCRVRNGFIQDSVIHYVFNGDIGNGYSGVIYNRLRLRTMNHHRNTWGLIGQFDYAYPAVASFGVDKMDESVMIAFLRSGGQLYPEFCIVNYDGQNWSPGGSMVVKNGETYSDIFLAEPIERWGDYIGICRKYNSPNRALWLAGHYGVAANMWGNGHGWNTWIAEVLDTVGNSITNPSIPSPVKNWMVFPNPASRQVVARTVLESPAFLSFSIIDLAGKEVMKWEGEMCPAGQVDRALETDKLPNGVYLLNLKIENQLIGYEKVCIVH